VKLYIKAGFVVVGREIKHPMTNIRLE
jgi:hypothetical protein